MKQQTTYHSIYACFLLILISLLSLTACQKNSRQESDATADQVENRSDTVVDVSSEDDTAKTRVYQTENNTAKLRPPVSIDYKILGTPQVGQLLEIELIVSSTLEDLPVQVDYRAVDTDALQVMPTNGANQSFKLANVNRPGKRKIVVVPQREGRSLFTVTTQFETPEGPMASSKTIAIQVGDASLDKKINGELKTDENGETVISMPAN